MELPTPTATTAPSPVARVVRGPGGTDDPFRAEGDPAAARGAPDEALVPFWELVGALVAVSEPVQTPDGGVAAVIEEMELDLPVELDVLTVCDRLVLAAAPPTQQTETTVLPVFHRFRLRVTRGGPGDPGTDRHLSRDGG